MFDALRAVEVISRPLSEGVAAGYGSGYFLGGGLILTCAHILPHGSSYERLVRRTDGRELPFVVAWRNDTHDIALLAVGWPEPMPVARIGRLPLVTSEQQMAFVMLGWPRLRDDGSVRNPVQVAGPLMLAETASSKTGVVALRPHMSLPPSTNADDWKGMSGATALCNGYIVAVQVARTRTIDLLEGRLLTTDVLSLPDGGRGGWSATELLLGAGIDWADIGATSDQPYPRHVSDQPTGRGYWASGSSSSRTSSQDDLPLVDIVETTEAILRLPAGDLFILSREFLRELVDPPRRSDEDGGLDHV